MIISERNFSVGTHGPFEVQGSGGNLALHMTIENWPKVDRLFDVHLHWSDGSGAIFHVSGNQIDKHGKPKTGGSVEVGCPPVDVTGGTATIEVYEPFTSKFTLEVIK